MFWLLTVCAVGDAYYYAEYGSSSAFAGLVFCALGAFYFAVQERA